METRPGFQAAFGRRLKAAREAAGLSLRSAGERAGVSYVTIHDAEAGRKVPTTFTAYLLAGVYEVSVGSLFGEK